MYDAHIAYKTKTVTTTLPPSNTQSIARIIRNFGPVRRATLANLIRMHHNALWLRRKRRPELHRGETGDEGWLRYLSHSGVTLSVGIDNPSMAMDEATNEATVFVVEGRWERPARISKVSFDTGQHGLSALRLLPFKL